MGQRRFEIALAFLALMAIGLGGGATGVLLPAQISEYHVNKSIIGLLFFTFSAGYILAGAMTGWLLRRLGLRGTLVLGSVVFSASTLLSGLRPAYSFLLLLSVLFGFGTGVMDATLNAFLATLPNRTTLLNLLHAFYGVGALIGPVMASALLDRGFSWGTVYLGFAAAGTILVIGFALRYPRELPAHDDPEQPAEAPPTTSVFSAAIRHPAVLLGALFLNIYVGVEVSLGNWAFSFMIEERGQDTLLAGWVVSGFWLGFTLGRFVLSALAARFGIGPVELTYACLLLLLAGALVTWLVPGTVMAAVGFVLLGSALGPVFPLTIAVLPRLAPAWLVPTAVGLLVGVSVIGGAVLPWLAGVIAENAGVGSLLPFTVGFTIVLLTNWWWLARRLSRSARSG
jgi:fucose permease